MLTNKRPIDNAGDFPSPKVAKFEGPYRGRGYFPRRGSSRGRFGFNRGRGRFSRGRSFRGSFNRCSVTQAVEDSGTLKVGIPISEESYKPILNEILENCDQIIDSGELRTWWNTQDLIENLSLLRKITSDNIPIHFKVSQSFESEYKKLLYIPKKYLSRKDEVFKFFNSASISKLLENKYILTFSSKDAASKASKRVMITDDDIICLTDYHENDVLYSSFHNKSLEELNEKLKSLRKEGNEHVNENKMETDEEEEEGDSDEDGDEDNEEQEQGGSDEVGDEDNEEEEEGDSEVGDEDEEEEGDSDEVGDEDNEEEEEGDSDEVGDEDNEEEEDDEEEDDEE